MRSRRPLDSKQSPLRLPSLPSAALADLINLTSGALVAILLARLLGPAGRGEVLIASIGPGIVKVLGTAGIEEAVVLTVGRAAEKTAKSREAWTAFLTAALLGLGASTVALMLQIVYVGERAPNVSRTVLYLFATQPLLYGLNEAILGSLRGEARYRSWNRLRVIGPIAYLMGLVVLILSNNVSATNALLILWLGPTIQFPILLGVFVSSNKQPYWGRKEVRRLLSLGLRNHLMVAQSMANRRLDQFLMARLLSSAAVGQYAVAATYAEFGSTISLTIGGQLYSHLAVTGGLMRDQFKKLVRKVLLMMIPLALAAMALAPILLPLTVGAAFRTAVVPAVILTIGVPLLSVNAVYVGAWKASGRLRYPALAEGAALVVTVLGVLVVVPIFGILGAAVVSICAYAVSTGILVFGPTPSGIGQHSTPVDNKSQDGKGPAA